MKQKKFVSILAGIMAVLMVLGLVSMIVPYLV